MLSRHVFIKADPHCEVRAFPVGLFFLSLGGDRFLDVAWEVTSVNNVAAAQQFRQSIYRNLL